MWVADCIFETARRARVSRDWACYPDFLEYATVQCRKIPGADPMLVTLAIQAAW